MSAKSKTEQLQRPVRLTMVALACILAAGCASIQPDALTTSDLQPLTSADTAAIREGVEPIVEPLTLEEALARALKYNLDRRTKLMEEALALGQVDIAKMDMLPKVLAQAGYSWRNNDRISNSLDPSTQTPVTNRFISSDRQHTTSELGLTWSLLDVGLGYYGAQQQTNRFLIASERRRKAMHLLMQDVRTAYWRAASAQLLRDEVAQTIDLAQDALADARRAEAERIRSPLESLRYQRQLMENLRLLESISQEMSSAQIDLASLINAPVGPVIPLAERDLINIDDQVMKVAVGCMEEVALSQNPDLREQHYNTRIARDETRRTLARLFPNITFNYGIKYDSDSYLVNRNWNEAGLQVSFNLMNLFTGATQIKMAEAGVALSDQRRVAAQLAVITQVHLARLQLVNARNQYEHADAIYATDRKISEVTRNRQNALSQSQLDLVSNNTAAILSLLRKYQALSQVQVSENRLTAALGLEPEIGSTDELALNDLALQLQSYKAPWVTMLEKTDCRVELPAKVVKKPQLPAKKALAGVDPQPTVPEVAATTPVVPKVATPEPAVALQKPELPPVVKAAAANPNREFRLSGFVFNGVVLNKGVAELNDFVKYVRDTYPDLSRVQIKVTGHADPMGQPRLYQPLSEARANMVVEYLRANGLGGASMTTEGRGASEPVEKNCLKEDLVQAKLCNAPNRRVDIQISTQPE